MSRPAGRYEIEAGQPIVVELHYENGAHETVRATLYRVPMVAGRTAMRLELRNCVEVES